jgi:hypothetical protein
LWIEQKKMTGRTGGPTMTKQALCDTDTMERPTGRNQVSGRNAVPGRVAADRRWLSRLIEAYDQVSRSDVCATPCDGRLLRAAKDHLMHPTG